MHHLATDMTRRGHHVVVIAPGSEKHRHAFEINYPHVRCLRARSKRFLVGNALPSLLSAHMRHRFDLVHCQGEYHETVAARYFKGLTGVPYVCRPIGGGFTNVEGYPRLQKKIVKALSGGELVFAQGAFLKKRIKNHGVTDDKIVTIHNGVRIEEVRRYRSCPPVVDPPYLFYAGGLKQVKGYDVALNAFGQVAGRYPDLKLVLMGIDQEIDAFNALADRLGLGDRIRYLHWCDRPTVASLFCHAEIYLCPFHRSPFSNANLEAMAAGTPVIATAVEGNLEQISDGVEGFLVPPDNSGALADRIDQILGNPALHRKMRDNALERARFFDWQNMVDRYENAYRTVLAAKRIPR